MTSLADRGGRVVRLSVSHCQTYNDILGVGMLIGQTDIGNCMECLGCESQEKRRDGNVVDVFASGQTLYTLGGGGKRYEKRFKEHFWRPMTHARGDKVTQPSPGPVGWGSRQTDG
jgi:hypothetical protein